MKSLIQYYSIDFGVTGFSGPMIACINYIEKDKSIFEGF
jgi:hypothetical protein